MAILHGGLSGLANHTGFRYLHPLAPKRGLDCHHGSIAWTVVPN